MEKPKINIHMSDAVQRESEKGDSRAFTTATELYYSVGLDAATTIFSITTTLCLKYNIPRFAVHNYWCKGLVWLAARD